MVEDVILLKECYDMLLKEDEYFVFVVFERKIWKFVIELDSLSVMYLYSEIKCFLILKIEIVLQKKIFEKLRFEVGFFVENLDIGFGKLK